MQANRPQSASIWATTIFHCDHFSWVYFISRGDSKRRPLFRHLPWLVGLCDDNPEQCVNGISALDYINILAHKVRKAPKDMALNVQDV